LKVLGEPAGTSPLTAAPPPSLSSIARVIDDREEGGIVKGASSETGRNSMVSLQQSAPPNEVSGVVFATRRPSPDVATTTGKRIGRGEAAGEGRAVPFAREEGSRDRVKGFISWRVQSGPVSYSRGRTTTSVRVHTICMHNSCACEHVHVHVHAHVHVTCTCLCLYHNTQDHGETLCLCGGMGRV
jgi:hypothetical protein